MKNYIGLKKIIYNTNKRNVFEILIFLVALLMCFDKLTMRVFIVLTAICCLFKGNYVVFKNKLSLFKLSVTLLWLIPFIQIIISSSFLLYWNKLETKLSLLIFPLIILNSLKFRNDLIYNVLKLFIYGCIISMFLCISNAILNFFSFNNISYFSYRTLSVFHHPSYYSMYINFSIGIFYIRLLYPLKKNK